MASTRCLTVTCEGLESSLWVAFFVFCSAQSTNISENMWL